MTQDGPAGLLLSISLFIFFSVGYVAASMVNQQLSMLNPDATTNTGHSYIDMLMRGVPSEASTSDAVRGERNARERPQSIL